MNIRELKELIKDLPDNMPFGLIDGTTDDTDDMNYSVSKKDFIVEDCYDNDSESETYGEIKGKMLFLYFENKLNENPI